MKRIVSLILALSMVLSMFTMSFAATDLTDINGTKFEAAVENLIELGIVAGYPDGTYLPEKVVTRAELAKLLVVSYGLEPAAEASKGATAFSDIGADHWASGYINVSSDYKFVNGYPEGTFKGDATVTYAEAITMCLRVLGYANEIDAKGTWPTNYIAKAQDLGLMEDIEFASYNEGAKRGNIAILIWNMLREDMWTVKGETEGDGLEYRPDTPMINVKFKDFDYSDEAIFNGYSITSSAKEEEPVVEMVVGNKTFKYEKNDFYTFVPGTEVEVLVNTKEETLVTIVPTADNKIVKGSKAEMEDKEYEALSGEGFDYVYGLVESRDVAKNTMILATSYHLDKVETNAKGKMTLTSNGVDTLSFTEAERDAEIFLKDGERVELDEIEVGEILTKVEVKYSGAASDARTFWIIGSEKVEGELTKYVVKEFEDGVPYHVITVDGEEIYVATNARYVEDTTKSKITTQAFFNVEDEKMKGEEIVVKVDATFGKAVRVEFDGKIDAGSDTVAWKFFGADSDVFVDGKGYAIELQDANGSKEYTFRDKTAGKELFGLESRVQGGFLAVQLDENDEIASYKLLATRAKDADGEYTQVVYGDLTDLLYGEEVDNEKYTFTKVEAGKFNEDENKFADITATDSTTVVRLVFDDNGTAKTSDDECYVEFSAGLEALKAVNTDGEDAIVIKDAADEIDRAKYVVLFSEKQDKSDIKVGMVTDVQVNKIDKSKQDVSIEDADPIVTEEGTADLSKHQLIVYKVKTNAKEEEFLSYVDGLADADLRADTEMLTVKTADGKLVRYTDGSQVDYAAESNVKKYEDYFVVAVSVTNKDDVQYEVSTYDAITFADIVFAEDDRVVINDATEVIFVISGISVEEAEEEAPVAPEAPEAPEVSGDAPEAPVAPEVSGEAPVVPAPEVSGEGSGDGQ